ncbi:hypothetical protein Acr_29g0000770 [Actinidia rufa]|uniref:Kinesin motor domain-containing protein n=1 Tax=Actinidia rufa TaxID=165716 RepID=A0A7J0HD64_9ERIC|nr:hypothetical protein Acr_29g0000770 [Actinidia rufa]
MASRHGSKSKKLSARGVNSPSSSTTSSSKHFPETSVDEPQYFYSESVATDAERSKENVTVTVRFRPLRDMSPNWVRVNCRHCNF